MPPRTPLNPVIHGRIDRGDYSVEKVIFESMPGFFVTGSLYRPQGRTGPYPGVLCPHGHWSDGRFHEAGIQETRREIAAGAERFEDSGRSPLQARCVQLARMGCVVFHYDMLGYADSVQIPMAVAHSFAKQRPELNTGESWGLYSPAAESHLQSVMGLQTWNSIRSLDFLLQLPDVDASRVGVTGASGGGTQTFLLCAIDHRPTVAMPAVMVSTAMQGGCTCENACLLRIGTGNVEFAALFAPKPLGLTAADDWTREMPTKGFPELQKHYALFDALDRVMLKPLLHFGHNYNHISRGAMYSWFNQHLKLGQTEPIIEQDYRRLSRSELSVWDAARPAPAGGPEFEKRLLRWWHEETQKALNQTLKSPESFQQIVRSGVARILGRGLPGQGDVSAREIRREQRPDAEHLVALRVRHEPANEEMPVLMLVPEKPDGRMLLWLDARGTAGLFDEGGSVRPEVRTLLERGVGVVGVDLIMQGDSLGGSESPSRTRRVNNPREAAAYTYGYNHSLMAQRTHDVLTVLSWLRSAPLTQSGRAHRLGLLGLGEAARWGAAARAMAPDAVSIAALDTEGFRFAQVRDLHDPSFLPGGARYFDIPGLIALGSPGPLWIGGEGVSVGDLPGVVQVAYRGSEDRLGLAKKNAVPAADAVAWMLKTWR
jgi:dienelactone hydrolase